MLNKEICIKFSEYKAWEREQELKKVNRKRINKFLVIGLGTTLFLINNPNIALASSLSSLDGIDNLGNTFLIIVRRIGYWIALIGAITEIIKNGMQGSGKDEIFKILIKYSLIYGALFVTPKLFDLIANALA